MKWDLLFDSHEIDFNGVKKSAKMEPQELPQAGADCSPSMHKALW